MALVKCKECGNAVSSKAQTCPKCGARVARKPIGCGMLIGIVLLGAIALGLAMQFSSPKLSEAPSVGNLGANDGAVVRAGPTPYTLSPASTRSLIQTVSAIRNAEGGLVVSGVVLLPKGTKVWVQPLSSDGKRILTQAETYVGNEGKFSTEPLFSGDGSILKPGPQKVELLSHFTNLWQSSEVLGLVGENGSKLPSAALHPDDPEFPKNGGHLEEELTLSVPPLSMETVAIERVKKARLSVPNKGLSSEPVGKVIAWFDKAGVKSLDWSAAQESGRWVVSLDCQDGATRKKARWEYDEATHTVRYLDPLAKTLSWLPKD
jgi:hypothetical protein